MNMVTDDELRQIMPNCPASKRADYLPFIQQAMTEFEITSYLRETAFLAQLAHESAELRYMEEIASGAAYEGRKDLGNTQPGDGKRYKGRGPIQLTGRANYTKYGGLLGLDLVNDPTIAATKEVGFRVAGQFWKLNGLNELADQQQFKLITKRINGGYNGLDDVLLAECQKRNIPLIEDVCESHGATFRGRRLGSFGFASNFSFYYAHHMSTIEGGMVCTDDTEVYQRYYGNAHAAPHLLGDFVPGIPELHRESLRGAA